MSSDRVVLIGPRGAGKTAVGPILAARLGLSFCDSDDVIESAGRSIPELMASGEFRAAEERAVSSLLAGPAGVVAVGGGAVLWPGFARAASGWTVIWLDARTEVLAARIRGSDRPSLTGRPADEEIGDVRDARTPLYRAVASKGIDTSELSPTQVAIRIEKLLRNDDKTRSPKAD